VGRVVRRRHVVVVAGSIFCAMWFFLMVLLAGTGIKAAKSETLQMWRIVVVLMVDQVSMENKCNERRTSGAWVRVLVFAFNAFVLFTIHFIIPPPLAKFWIYCLTFLSF
jgi:hypothetical protein